MKLKILLIVALAFVQNESMANENIRLNSDGSISVMTQASRVIQFSSENSAYLMTKRAALTNAYHIAAKYFKTKRIYIKKAEYSSIDDFLANDCVGVVAILSKTPPAKMKILTLTQKDYAKISRGSCGYYLEGEKSILMLSLSFNELGELRKKSEPIIVINYSSDNEIIPAESEPAYLQLILNRIECPKSITLYFETDLIYKIYLH